MAKQRRVIGAKEKAKVALAAVRAQNTSRELSVQFKVHQTQIGAWKKKLVDEAPSVFERGTTAGSTPYRHWKFIPKEFEIDGAKSKPK